MKTKSIVLVGSHDDRLDYLINSFIKYKKSLIIICEDEVYANILASKYNMPIFVGNPSKIHDLEEANIKDSDLFIALCSKDYDSFVSCLLAKNIFNVKKTICAAYNPKNVSIFEKLGIDSVISSTHLLVENIKTDISIEDAVKTISLEKGKIAVTELQLESEDFILGKALKDVEFPFEANIACIYRHGKILIPRGNTVVEKGDRLTIVSESINIASITHYIKNGK